MSKGSSGASLERGRKLSTPTKIARKAKSLIRRNERKESQPLHSVDQLRGRNIYEIPPGFQDESPNFLRQNANGPQSTPAKSPGILRSRTALRMPKSALNGFDNNEFSRFLEDARDDDKPLPERRKSVSFPELLPQQSSENSFEDKSLDSRQSSTVSRVKRYLPELSVTSISVTNTKLAKFLSFIDPFIVACIIINAITIGLSTFEFIDGNPRNQEVFENIDLAFLIIFTIEVSLTAISYSRIDQLKFEDDSWWPKLDPVPEKEISLRRQTRAWLVFDATVVILSWVFNKGSVSIIRAFRIFRTLRLLSKVRSLKNITRALMHVFPKAGALAFITVILFVVMGTMTTELFHDMELSEDYFGRFDLSLLTLFQMMTFDNWHEPAREIMEKDPHSWILFCFWVFISGFVIMNLMIAVICEALVKLDEIGVKAFKGQVESDDFSIRDVSSVSSRGVFEDQPVIARKLEEMELALHEMLRREEIILAELEKLKKP